MINFLRRLFKKKPVITSKVYVVGDKACDRQRPTAGMLTLEEVRELKLY